MKQKASFQLFLPPQDENLYLHTKFQTAILKKVIFTISFLD